MASVYLWHSQGLSKKNLDLLVTLGSKLAGQALPVCNAGDWNMHPTLLEESGFTNIFHSRIVWDPTTASFRSGPQRATLDYFVCSRRMQPMGLRAGLLKPSLVRPRYPVVVRLPVRMR